MRYFNNTIFLFFVFMFSGVGASEFKSGQSVDYKGDVKENLYVAASHVSVTGNVKGDLNIAGGDIFYKGHADKDAQFIGGKIQAEIAGADDVRIIGGEVKLTVKNSGDVLLFGGDTTISPASEIGGDLFIMGGKAVMDGRVKGNVHVWGGDVLVKGTIAGKLEIHSETAKIEAKVKGASQLSARNLIVQPEARFQGAVQYWSDNKADFHDNVADGKATFHEELRGNRSNYKWSQHWLWYGLWFPASAALTIFLVTFFMPILLRQGSRQLLAAPVAALGYGLLYYLAIPVAAILLFITVIGIPIGILLCAIHCFSIVFARPVSSAIIAAALADRYKKNWTRWMLVLVATGVYLALSIILMIPVAGGILNMLAVLAAIGAMVHVLVERYRAPKEEKPARKTKKA